MIAPQATTTASGMQSAGRKAGLPARRPWWLDGATHHCLLKAVPGHFHTRVRWVGLAGGVDTQPRVCGAREAHPGMHGSLPLLQFHGDCFRLPAMENAGHEHCGRSREAQGAEGCCRLPRACPGDSWALSGSPGPPRVSQGVMLQWLLLLGIR